MGHLVRRRRTQAAIGELMETVYEALREAADNNPTGVSASDIATKAFIPLDESYVHFTQYILNQLALTGFAVNDTSGELGLWLPKTHT